MLDHYGNGKYVTNAQRWFIIILLGAMMSIFFTWFMINAFSTGPSYKTPEEQAAAAYDNCTYRASLRFSGDTEVMALNDCKELFIQSKN